MNQEVTIRGMKVEDIRFPTSREAIGSDALNTDPDYSAAYVILETDHPLHIEGHGLTFTIGRGNEVCVAAIRAMEHFVIGKRMSDITEDMAGFWKKLTTDSQLRWLGPEKGVIHLATGALVNAVWDLYAKLERKPLWQLIIDMSPEEVANCIDFRYISDVLTYKEVIELLREREHTKAERIAYLMQNGYPAYTTSAGWLGYSEEKIREQVIVARNEGWKHLKMKVGLDLEDDVRRARIIREIIGDEMTLMMDANQKWEVDEAIERMKVLAQFNPLWIEEPTNPDDILGHARIANSIGPISVASGEHCHNRVMFKQFMQAGAMGFCQIDSCRVAGVNEVLAIMLMAHKFGIPVCPHAGGVGLCEYVQHLAIIDYVAISGSLDHRIIEYVDHLHEHFKDPVVIRDAAYVVPGAPGFSIEMKENSRKTYRFPDGTFWKHDLAMGAVK